MQGIQVGDGDGFSRDQSAHRKNWRRKLPTSNPTAHMNRVEQDWSNSEQGVQVGLEADGILPATMNGAQVTVAYTHKGRSKDLSNDINDIRIATHSGEVPVEHLTRPPSTRGISPELSLEAVVTGSVVDLMQYHLDKASNTDRGFPKPEDYKFDLVIMHLPENRSFIFQGVWVRKMNTTTEYSNNGTDQMAQVTMSYDSVSTDSTLR